MDVVRLGERAKRLAVAAGLLAVTGALVAPVTTVAAAPLQPTVDPRQLALDAQRSGPGFQIHTDSRGGQPAADVNVCSTAVAPAAAHCDARVRTDAHAHSLRPARVGQAHPSDTLGNSGAYDPSYLQSAYNLAGVIGSGAGAGQIIAIVDAYDSPSAAVDMANYRSWFGLPTLPTCTTWPSTTACFNKVNESGLASPLPATDAGWAEEIALDLDMASAMCPACSILLVEANSNGLGDLSSAANEAVLLGANVVSNSYGGGEWSGETLFDSEYNHPGVAVTASTGDAGYGTEWPAASQYVTAVGGTSLLQATNTGTRSATETAWSGAGSGCSAYEAKPEWQTDAACTNRTIADVSAVADPNTGVWVYDTTGGAGWEILGGTSVASPIVASVYALAGNSLTSKLLLNSDPYGHLPALFDVTSGSNGTCGGTYLCSGAVGYDGPTGLGTPNGIAAFVNAVVVLPPPPVADFSLNLQTTTLNVTRGGPNVTDTLAASALNGYHSAVTLSVSGLPAGLTATFGPTQVTPTGTSRITVHAGARTVAGTYPLLIKATGKDGTVHTQVLSVKVR